MAQTALQRALSGESLTDNQTKKALDSALGKLKTLSGKAKKAKEAAGAAGAAAIATAEFQTALFAGCFTEGWLGRDKVHVGPVDVRLGLGLIAAGYGLYDATQGGGGHGMHALAVGNGLMGSAVASIGLQAGAEMRAKKQQPAPQPAVGGEPSEQLEPHTTDSLSGEAPVREIRLSPIDVPRRSAFRADQFRAR